MGNPLQMNRRPRKLLAQKWRSLLRAAKTKSDTFSIFACHPCAGAMLIFSVSFQFLRMTPKSSVAGVLVRAYGGVEARLVRYGPDTPRLGPPPPPSH